MAEYAMKVEKGITVTMRDGVKISLCVVSPRRAGEFRHCLPPRPTNTRWMRCRPIRCFLWRETGRSSGTSSRFMSTSTPTCAGAGQSEGDFEFMD